MNLTKITAPTAREARRLLREALGPDAVLLDNREVPEGMELTAIARGDLERLRQGEIPVMPGAAADLAAHLSSARAADQRAADPLSAVSEAIRADLRDLKGVLEARIAEIAWDAGAQRNPLRVAVMKDMLAAGFGAGLARHVTHRMPAFDSAEEGMKWVRAALAQNLHVHGDDDTLLGNGGIFALVGPTGVGKTTTTAKLAARCVKRNGPGKLALITTDAYRIGAYEQLRIYGNILGVMVHAVKDEADLRIALGELKNKHTVLIDTVGMSQRDQMVAEQVAMLSGAGAEVKRLLCLNATSNGETLNEVVRSYLGGGLAGCILTKLDEAATVGNVLDVLIRSKLSLYYCANGQRVPEDIHPADRDRLIDLAFQPRRDSGPFQLKDAEVPLAAANGFDDAVSLTLKEARIG